MVGYTSRIGFNPQLLFTTLKGQVVDEQLTLEEYIRHHGPDFGAYGLRHPFRQVTRRGSQEITAETNLLFVCDYNETVCRISYRSGTIRVLGESDPDEFEDIQLDFPQALTLQQGSEITLPPTLRIRLFGRLNEDSFSTSIIRAESIGRGLRLPANYEQFLPNEAMLEPWAVPLVKKQGEQLHYATNNR